MSGTVVQLRTCPVERCGASIRRGYLMCSRHWIRVPRDLREEVRVWWRYYQVRIGEARLAAYQRYLLARSNAIRAVNNKISQEASDAVEP